MGREVTLPSRPCTVNGKHYPAEPLTAVYEPHEIEFMRALRERIGQLEPGSDERKALIAEAQTIHEAKALLGARITADGEVEGLEPAPSATEALKVMDGLAEKDERWALGPKARAALAEGQTVLLEPPSRPLRMPYRDDEPDMRDPEPPAWSSTPPDSERPGRFYGHDATATEREAGAAKEVEDTGPLKPGSAAHSVLLVYADRRRRTSYQASLEACDDYHARRRESTRLLTRGFLRKSGMLPNPAPGGRDSVDAYEITIQGREELVRLGREAVVS